MSHRTGLATCLALVLCTGCATSFDWIDKGPSPMQGTRLWSGVVTGEDRLGDVWFLVWDVPFSFVADVVTLPVTVPYSLAEHFEEEAEREAEARAYDQRQAELAAKRAARKAAKRRARAEAARRLSESYWDTGE